MTTQTIDLMTAPLIEERTGIKASTIKRMRLDNKIQNYTRLGKIYLYSLSEIISFCKKPQPQAA